eukprot:scaffold14325_cov222-Isochrysis_galbana.AAC.1
MIINQRHKNEVHPRCTVRERPVECEGERERLQRGAECWLAVRSASAHSLPPGAPRASLGAAPAFPFSLPLPPRVHAPPVAVPSASPPTHHPSYPHSSAIDGNPSNSPSCITLSPTL